MDVVEVTVLEKFGDDAARPIPEVIGVADHDVGKCFDVSVLPLHVVARLRHRLLRCSRCGNGGRRIDGARLQKRFDGLDNGARLEHDTEVNHFLLLRHRLHLRGNRHSNDLVQVSAKEAWMRLAPPFDPALDQAYEEALGLNRPGVIRYRERMAKKAKARGE